MGGRADSGSVWGASGSCSAGDLAGTAGNVGPARVRRGERAGAGDTARSGGRGVLRCATECPGRADVGGAARARGRLERGADAGAGGERGESWYRVMRSRVRDE